MNWTAVISLVVGLGAGVGLGLMLTKDHAPEHSHVGDDDAPAAVTPAGETHAEHEDEHADAVCRVRVAKLTVGDLALPLVTFGTVQIAPASLRQVAAPYESLITAVPVAAGATVTAGTLLVEIAPSPDVIAQSEEAQLVLRSAEQELTQTRQRLDLHLATAQELAQAQAAADLARLKANTWRTRLADGGRHLVAASSARINAVLVHAGQLVPAGTPVIELVTSDAKEVHLGFAPNDRVRLQDERTVHVSAVRRDGPTTALPLTIASFANQLTPETGLLDAVAPLPADTTLIPGEAVRGECALSLKQALIANRAALVRTEDGWVVFTVADHHAVRHAVELIAETRTQAALIAKDLHDGDALIVEGNAEVTAGMTVEILSGESP